MTIIKGFIREGADNHMVKHPDELVRRVRLLHSRGYQAAEIRAHLLDEGHDVSRSTIQTWVSKASRMKA